jgi:WD40 repeat protein
MLSLIFLVVGSDDGHVRLLNVNAMIQQRDPVVTNFQSFPNLTSVSANSLDEKFIVSGYSRDVAMYDVNTGSQISVFSDLHERAHINVVKFSNCNPNCFVTSSFDSFIKFWDIRIGVTGNGPVYQQKSERGCVMVCFSDDDRYVLASAVDNLVTQVTNGSVWRKESLIRDWPLD